MHCVGSKHIKFSVICCCVCVLGTLFYLTKGEEETAFASVDY